MKQKTWFSAALKRMVMEVEVEEGRECFRECSLVRAHSVKVFYVCCLKSDEFLTSPG